MADAGLAALEGMVRELVRAFETNELIAKLLLSALALLVLSLFLRLYRSLLDRMVEARRIQEDAAVRLYRIVELAAVVLMMFVIAYFMTRSPYLIYVITGTTLVVVASAWEAILNVIYYYIILFTGVIRPGNIVRVGEVYGRVSDVRLFHTLILRPGSPRRLYMVPHRVLMSRGFVLVDEACVVTVKVEVHNVSPDDVDNIVEDIKTRVVEEARAGVVTVRSEGSVRVYVKSITNNSASILIQLETGYLLGREHRLGPLLYLLAAAVREAVPTARFTVELDSIRCGGGQGVAQEEVQ